MKAISHRDKIVHSSNELVEVTAQPCKVNLKKYVCQLRSVKRFLMSNRVNNDINIRLFQHIMIVVEI